MRWIWLLTFACASPHADSENGEVETGAEVEHETGPEVEGEPTREPPQEAEAEAEGEPEAEPEAEEAEPEAEAEAQAAHELEAPEASTARDAVPIQTPAAPTARSCARANPEHLGCRWAVEEKPVCQGILRQPGDPGPPPQRVCVCHQCQRDRDCRDQPDGTCGTLPSSCSNAERRVCVYDDPCVTCPGPCSVGTNPDTGARVAYCRPPAPPPSAMRGLR